MNVVKKAVIPVAGYGTRFLPYTKAVPKAMLPILNKPAIQIITDEVVKSGITDILFIVGYKKDIIENHFKSSPKLEETLLKNKKTNFYNMIKEPETMANVSFVEQLTLDGTGGAIRLAKDFVGNEPFAVLFGDDVMYNENKPVTQQLIDVYNNTKKTVIGCKKVPLKDVPKYASVEYDKQDGNCYTVTKITEKPPIELVKSDLSPLGRYVCTPEIFDIIENLQPAPNGEIQFTDALDIISRGQGATALVFDGTRYDMGGQIGYLKANIEFGLRDKEIGEELKAYLKTLDI